MHGSAGLVAGHRRHGVPPTPQWGPACPLGGSRYPLLRDMRGAAKIADRGEFSTGRAVGRPRSHQLAVSSRLRGIILNVLLIVAAIAVALGVLELLLRARPTLLGAAYANGVLSKYTDGAGGIFY